MYTRIKPLFARTHFVWQISCAKRFWPCKLGVFWTNAFVKINLSKIPNLHAQSFCRVKRASTCVCKRAFIQKAHVTFYPNMQRKFGIHAVVLCCHEIYAQTQLKLPVFDIAYIWPTYYIIAYYFVFWESLTRWYDRNFKIERYSRSRFLAEYTFCITSICDRIVLQVIASCRKILVVKHRKVGFILCIPFPHNLRPNLFAKIHIKLS